MDNSTADHRQSFEIKYKEKTYKIATPPTPNMKVTLGEDAFTYFQYYCKSPPNRVQRWMLKKLLGIKVEML